MNPTDPNIFYLCHSIYKIYKIIGKNFVTWIEPILEIIDKIACYIFFKMNNDNMEVDSDEVCFRIVSNKYRFNYWMNFLF